MVYNREEFIVRPWGICAMRPNFLLAICLLAPVHTAFADLSWYLGAGGSLTGHKTRGFSTNSSIMASLDPNQSLSTDDFKDRTLGWQLYGGLMFTKNFGVSLKYLDSGNAKDQWSGTLKTVEPGTPPVTTEKDVFFDGDMRIDGYTLYFIQTLPVSEKIEYTLEIGYSKQNLDFTWGSTDLPGSLSKNDKGLIAGGIFRYKFTKHFAVSSEIEYSTVNFSDLIENPLKFSLNGEFHF